MEVQLKGPGRRTMNYSDSFVSVAKLMGGLKMCLNHARVDQRLNVGHFVLGSL